ncbi:DUF4097 family beta strand repeat-containing protein [Thalassotalea marina]|uniref:DUF4097 domain-containing protein n=1 Tax=Thalassotalea marina TaxID=1673741 RepID=A0A919BCK7_9GAMM|nr:DUF4097 family beta strand repeat-containing protein [Thalassotalea marina]GHF82404.1 hypothetical protein GCM10017161_06980 [Thalassotalea marina]
MHFSKLLGGLAIIAISLPALAGEKVDKSLSAKDVTKVCIDNLRGEVKIKGWSKEQVDVSGELDDETEEFVFEKIGSTIVIKVKVHNNQRNFNDEDGSDLNISVPQNVRVEFNGVSSDFSIADIEGGVEGKSVSGNITASAIKSHAELSTVSGNIDAKDLHGKIQMTSVSGDVNDVSSSGKLKLRSVSGKVDTKSNAKDVDLSVVSGDIEFSLAKVDELEVSSVSGEIEGKLSLNDNGRLEMSTVSGDIDIKFNNDVQASFRLKSNAGGNLVNRITDEKAKEAKYGPSSKLTFATGNASATVKGTTVSGTIRLGK